MPYKQIYVESDDENADSDETIEAEPPTEINKETAEEEVLSPVKKKKPKGRPPKPLEEKLAKKTIIKEKVIYMLPDDKGGYTEQKNKQLTKRDLKKIEERKKVEEMEKELGKKLLTKKNGKVDKRSIGEKTRTPAQIAATKAMLAANEKRRAAQRELKDLKKETKTKEIVKQSLEEVIYKPSPKPDIKPDPYANIRF